MSVLRRILAMRAAHAGWPGPGFPSWLSPATWWTATVAPCSHSSHRRLRSRWISSLRGAVTRTGAGSVMTARLSCLRGIPPNRAARSFLPSRQILASKQVLGPSAVMTFAVKRAVILVTVDLCLAGRVGCPARSRVQAGLFRAASLHTQRAPFVGPELSSDLCRERDRCCVNVLVASGADDECLAPHARHERGPRGLARSRLPECLEA